MNQNLYIWINFINETNINITDLRIKLLKFWIKTDIKLKDKFNYIIRIKDFKETFTIDIDDIINFLIIKCELKNINIIKYKLDLYANYKYLIHYFLLDFNLKEQDKEYIENISIKIIEKEIYIDKEKFKELKVELVNDTIIDVSTLRTGFDLDEVISKINNRVLNEKLIYFILQMRKKVLTYKLI